MSDPASSTTAAAPAVAPASPSSSSAYDDTLVMYVVMRSDLIKSHRWNVGGLISNGSHACLAVIMSNLADADVQRYTAPDAADQMHKVVLAAKDQRELEDTAELLHKQGMVHKLWVEQPEMLKSCLAVKPYPRKIIQPLLKALKLFR